ncbi:MAG: PAS-domain containing protein [Nannocystaceae bacterium]|nr:PAS-domain containing protein [Nannocystaceae bacterium]
MKLGIRGKLFVFSLAFVAIIGLVVGVVLDRRLSAVLHSRISAEIVRHAQAARVALDMAGAEPTLERLDPIADRLGAAMDARVTIIAADGTVLGDSGLALAEVAAMGSHRSRPEVVAALATGQGRSQRFSETLQREMTYVAVPYRGDGSVVRVGLAMDEIAVALAQLRAILVVTGLLALGAGAILAALASQLLSRSLRSLVATAKAIASDTGSITRLPEQPGDELSGLAGSFNVIVDELERTVTVLASERNRFETALDTMDQAVLSLDAARLVTMANRRAREMLELQERVIGRPLLDYIRVPALRELVAAAQRGEAAHAEFEHGTSPRLTLRAQASTQRDGGTIIVLHDVTEIRRLETIRKDFVANVSHELRTPVAVIRANAETLLAGALDDPKSAVIFIEALHRHADRLGRLVADLLDISRIEAGRYAMSAAPLALEAVVDRAIDGLSVEAREHGMDVRRAFDDGVWLVQADDEALEQILVNLISNAIRHSTGGSAVEIAVGEASLPGTVRIEVRDDGPGIDPKHHLRVFERFYRVDPGRSRDRGGTGLGLAIVKHLVEAMGGRLGVDARRPRGSTFWFTLPSEPAEEGSDPPPIES